MYINILAQLLLKNGQIKSINMDLMNFTRVSFHQILTLIERDDGNKKNKTLEKEAGLPSI